MALLREAMLKNADCKGFLIDGYPRDVPQGEQFELTVSTCDISVKTGTYRMSPSLHDSHNLLAITITLQSTQ